MTATGVTDIAATGVILAGGASRRFGADKAVARMPDGRAMIEHVAERIAAVCPRVVIVTDHDARYDHLLPDVARLIDDAPGAGPLAALATALRCIDGAALLAPCDMPALAPPLLQLLLDRRGQHDAVLLERGGVQPFPAVYERSCLPAAERCIEDGALALHQLLSRVRACVIPEDEWRAADPTGASFVNVNTPTDLVQFEGSAPPP